MLNVNLLIVNLRLCRLNNPQPVAEFTEPRAVPLSLAEGSGDRREPVPEAAYTKLGMPFSSF